MICVLSLHGNSSGLLHAHSSFFAQMGTPLSSHHEIDEASYIFTLFLCLLLCYKGRRALPPSTCDPDPVSIHLSEAFILQSSLSLLHYWSLLLGHDIPICHSQADVLGNVVFKTYTFSLNPTVINSPSLIPFLQNFSKICTHGLHFLTFHSCFNHSGFLYVWIFTAHSAEIDKLPSGQIHAHFACLLCLGLSAAFTEHSPLEKCCCFPWCHTILVFLLLYPPFPSWIICLYDF